MKDSKNDSTAALSRFGRDKRTRTVTATTERVERRPRQQREAAPAEQHREYKRNSFNPNFTRDNRPAFDENLVDRSETVPHMANIRNALTASVRTTVKNRTVIAMTGPNAANSVPMKNAPVHPVLSAINHPTAADTTGTIEPMEIVTSTTTVRTGITLLANSKNDLTTAARKNTVTNSANRRTPDSRSARNNLHLIRNTIPINKRGRFV